MRPVLSTTVWSSSNQRDPIWVVVHTNHADEITPEAEAALARLARAGVPLLSQTVLLRGINADADTLEALFRKLIRNRVKPYYLHHPDLARGTGHFRLGIAEGQLVWVRSRRGKVITRASISERINAGAVYMTYQWWIGACNELTQDNLDPISKTPETKYCAVQLEAIEDQRWAEDFAASAYQSMKSRLINAVNV